MSILVGAASKTDTEVEWQGRKWVLLAGHALFWPARSILLVADLHLGKSDTFRAAAVPVPGGSTADNLARLESLVCQTCARTVIVLGDMFHAPAGVGPRIVAAVRAWTDAHASVRLKLVPGNHDRHAAELNDQMGIETVSPVITIDGIELRHHPSLSDEGAPRVCGHLHPCVELQGMDRTTIRLPCFWQSSNEWVLPAFGAFTGCSKVQRRRSDRCWVVADDRVLELPMS